MYIELTSNDLAIEKLFSIVDIPLKKLGKIRESVYSSMIKSQKLYIFTKNVYEGMEHQTQHEHQKTTVGLLAKNEEHRLEYLRLKEIWETIKG